MFATDDSIVAIATPPGRGGIGIVRISGPGALDIANAILERRTSLVRALGDLVADANVIADDVRLAAYETDALTAYRQRPLAVVLPETTAEVAAILAFAHREGVKVVPRGAGTSLSGGAIPAADAIVLGLGKFNRILEIDYANRCVVAQSGVTNLAISHAVAADGFYYAPDPSSQIACTIGGNVAENSGGVHCLKYGLTTNNVLGLELVTPQGETVRLGGKHLDAGHYDLLGLTVGSEGLIGVVTEVTVRLTPKPQTARCIMARFGDIRHAGDALAAANAPSDTPTTCIGLAGACLRAHSTAARTSSCRYVEPPRV